MAAGMQTPNDLMATFSDTVSAGFAALQGPVNGIFGLMIALVVGLTGIQWALSSNRDILAASFGKVLLIGAFAYLINDWQALSETIQAGFIELGLAAGGGNLSRADFLNPGAILETGWEIVKALGETPAPVVNPVDILGNLADALILGLSIIGIMIAFAVLALQIIVTLLEFKIVTLGGFVLLPFGIWSKSAFLAERPLGYVAAAGLKSLALAIVISGAQTVFDELQPSANPGLYEALAILSASLLLAMLALFIPNLAAALVTGGPSLGAGSAVAAGLAVAGGAALAGIGAVQAGRLAAQGGAHAWRAAAGGGGGRSPPSQPMGPDSPATPSSPGAPGRPAGGASASGTGFQDASVTWRPDTKAAETDAPDTSAVAPSRSPQTVQAEAEQARHAFARALRAPPEEGHSGRRNAALQAFFAANAGRSLLAGSESVGSASPQLKSEEP